MEKWYAYYKPLVKNKVTPPIISSKDVYLMDDGLEKVATIVTNKPIKNPSKNTIYLGQVVKWIRRVP